MLFFLHELILYKKSRKVIKQIDDSELAGSFIELVELAAKLRSPEGCPWDRKQTIDTVKMYLLEECYEAMDAIEKKDYPEMCFELGDLLFMIVFLAQLSHEQALFDIADVINNIVKKMNGGCGHSNQTAKQVAENHQRRAHKSDSPDFAFSTRRGR